MRIAVTGGAGFIGSHLVGKLSEKNDVVVVDNFSSGKKEWVDNYDCEIKKVDILDREKLNQSLTGVEECYHLAADPDVKTSYHKPVENFKQDCKGTLNVLEACRKNDVKKIIFSSSSVVYGIANMPTPETAPIQPISNYGAAKAASENYIMSYSNLYNIQGTILRYANIIGPRATHGILYDFYNKLKDNPKELKILGDGSQKKSYLHVNDCVSGTIFAKEKTNDLGIFNLGSEEQISVKQISDVVCRYLDVTPKYNYTGGAKGWPGDVPKMLLSIDKIKSLGWNPKFSIKDAIKDTLSYLSKNN